MTARRQMQEQVAGAERLADLGRLAASLAHEIRNPLGAIVNSINALKHPRAAGDHRLHDIITEEAHRLDGIISDFLVFARPPASVPVVCSVAELLETAVILFERSDRLPRGVHLHWSCPPYVPDVHADPNQMRQVLWNLISNAVDATGADGSVDIVARLSADGSGVSIAITDDGPGVQNVNEMFRPFFTTKAHGTGLGLAVVAQIIRNHGGAITVNKVAERGARITFTIPIASSNVRPAETA